MRGSGCLDVYMPDGTQCRKIVQVCPGLVGKECLANVCKSVLLEYYRNQYLPSTSKSATSHIADLFLLHV
jgi:hypothetical protein